MKIWNYVTMELWKYGNMELWNYETMKLCNYETMEQIIQGYTGKTMELWNYGTNYTEKTKNYFHTINFKVPL